MLYRIHRYWLQRSQSAFSTMLSLEPVETEHGPEGSSDHNPIQLAGVTTVDFDRLLSLFYPL